MVWFGVHRLVRFGEGAAERRGGVLSSEGILSRDFPWEWFVVHLSCVYLVLVELRQGFEWKFLVFLHLLLLKDCSFGFLLPE